MRRNRFNLTSLGKDDLLKIPPFTFNYDLGPDDAIHMLKEFGGFWKRDHSLGSEAPHVKLTSGNCSDGYANWQKVLRYPILKYILAVALAKKLFHFIDDEKNFPEKGWVLGVPDGMSQFAGLMGVYLGMVAGDWKSAELVKNPDKSFVWKRDIIKSGESVIPVEDVTTTKGSLERMINTVIQDNFKRNPEQIQIWNPGVLLNRSGEKFVSAGSIQLEIVALVDMPMPIWKPEECPLCKEGSKPLSAKDHWDELMECCIKVG